MGANPAISWHDTCISTYAATTAFRVAGHTTIADESVNALSTIQTDTARCETLTFGGLVDTLDRITTFFGWRPPRHPDRVAQLIHEERRKWKKMCSWEFCYDPHLSIAGYCAERLFGSDQPDLVRVVESFQAGNGSIANSPGASAAVWRRTPPNAVTWWHWPGMSGRMGLRLFPRRETWHGWLMRLIDRLTMAQRVVVVVAMGIVLAFVGRYLTSLGEVRPGWYAYPTLTTRLGPPSTGMPTWLRLIVWLVLTATWASVSIIVLRRRAGGKG